MKVLGWLEKKDLVFVSVTRDGDIVIDYKEYYDDELGNTNYFINSEYYKDTPELRKELKKDFDVDLGV